MLIMVDLNPKVQAISTYIHTKRPTWQFIVEDNLLRIMANQFIVDWEIMEVLQKTFNIKIREVISHAGAGLVITLELPGGE